MNGVGFPMWALLIAVAVIVLCWWLARNARVGMWVEAVPAWICMLLVFLALAGMWLLLSVQFGGQVISVHL